MIYDGGVRVLIGREWMNVGVMLFDLVIYICRGNVISPRRTVKHITCVAIVSK